MYITGFSLAAHILTEQEVKVLWIIWDIISDELKPASAFSSWSLSQPPPGPDPLPLIGWEGLHYFDLLLGLFLASSLAPSWVSQPKASSYNPCLWLADTRQGGGGSEEKRIFVTFDSNRTSEFCELNTFLFNSLIHMKVAQCSFYTHSTKNGHFLTLSLGIYKMIYKMLTILNCIIFLKKLGNAFQL